MFVYGREDARFRNYVCSISGQDAFQPRDRIPRTPAKTDSGENCLVVFYFICSQIIMSYTMKVPWIVHFLIFQRFPIKQLNGLCATLLQFVPWNPGLSVLSVLLFFFVTSF